MNEDTLQENQLNLNQPRKKNKKKITSQAFETYLLKM